MKAIEILKYNKNIMIKFINSFDDDCKEDDEYISGNKYIEELNEAIKELEELNNRSCRNCNYCKEVYSYFYPLCVYNENEPFQIHNKQVLKCDFHKAKVE